MGRNKKLKTTRVYHTLFRIDKLIFVIYDDVVKNLKKLRFVYIFYEHSNRIILKSYYICINYTLDIL